MCGETGKGNATATDSPHTISLSLLSPVLRLIPYKSNIHIMVVAESTQFGC
jgi:hypothetical protein